METVIQTVEGEIRTTHEGRSRKTTLNQRILQELQRLQTKSRNILS